MVQILGRRRPSQRKTTMNQDGRAPSAKLPVSHIWLALITSLAAFLRFYALDQFPPGVWIDEALKGNLGLEAARTGNYRIFYPAIHGLEGLWINLIGISERVFGANPFGLRFCSALAGTLTVIVIYLLGRELFSRGVGLFAAWFLATSFWHLNFSRIAFRGILVPLLTAAPILLLLWSWRERKAQWSWLAAILGGTLFGLGFHTYTAFRIAPLLIAILLAVEFLERQSKGRVERRWFVLSGAWVAAAWVAALPLGIYFVRHPEDFWRRAGRVSAISGRFDLPALEYDLVVSLGMFNFRGDANWRHNIAGSPELLLPVGLLFLAGIGLSIPVARKNAACGKRFWWLIAWIPVFLLPAILASEGCPHALRAIGVIPSAFIFAGAGANRVMEKLASHKIYQGAFLAVVLVCGAVEGYRYFGVWARSPQVGAAFCRPLVMIGQYLNQLPKGKMRYVVVNETGMPFRHVNPDGSELLLPVQAQVVLWVTRNQEPITYLLPSQLRSADLPPGSVIIPLRPDPRLFEDLRKRGSAVQEIHHGEFIEGIME